MNATEPWLIQTSDLPVGTALKFDLVGPNGQLLQKSGELIDERLQRRLLQLGIDAIRVRESTQAQPTDTDSVLLSSFAEGAVAQIQASLELARTSLAELVRSKDEHDSTQVENLQASVCEFVIQAKKDIAATLAVIALNSKVHSSRIAERIINHSANLSLLSVTMSIVQQDDPVASFQIGLAGLLHDSWLLKHSDWFEFHPEARDEAQRKRYRWHPIECADMLNGIPGVPNTVLAMITEVHEQADGTGYPRGLTQEKVKPGSEILNLADAYLTLASPIEGTPVVSSDAIAYLCFHATKGKFCADTVRLLTRSLSMYPVGLTVELDDMSKAVVVRGNKKWPLSPVVRLLENDNEEVDLSASTRFIAKPHMSLKLNAERLNKSRFSETLWTTDR